MSKERARIQMLSRVFGKPPARVTLGIGDDAAVISDNGADTILSVDTAVEGVHFKRGWLSARDIGARSFSAALSDLGAMGATPVAALLALTTPEEVTDQFLRDIARGVQSVASAASCSVIGGNISGGRDLTLSTTVIGSSSGSILRRTGAKPGEALCVGGALGSAALGLAILQSNGTTQNAQDLPFIQAWRRPTAQVTLGQSLLGLASSAVDVSDGLLADTEALAGSCGFVIEVEKIPTHPQFYPTAQRHGYDPLELLLSGGEDYRLLFTCPIGEAPAGTTQIGTAVSTPGVRAVDTHGRTVSVARAGFEH